MSEVSILKCFYMVQNQQSKERKKKKKTVFKEVHECAKIQPGKRGLKIRSTYESTASGSPVSLGIGSAFHYPFLVPLWLHCLVSDCL